MITVLVISLIIDALLAYYLFRQAYVVRSNMNWKYKRRFLILLSVMGGAVLLCGFNLPLATLVAGVPACMLVLFGGIMAISLMTHKGPWH